MRISARAMRQVRIIMVATFFAALFMGALVLALGFMWLCAERPEVAAWMAFVLIVVAVALGFYKAAEQWIDDRDSE